MPDPAFQAFKAQFGLERPRNSPVPLFADTVFGLGSFLPHGYAAGPELLDGEFQAIGEGEPAWDELGEDLDAFDLVFCYPWPGDEGIVLDLVQRCARPDALLLFYRAGDGVELYRRGQLATLPELAP